MDWIDLVGGGLVVVFLLLGLARGLWWQVIRAVGVVLALVVARAASPEVAAWILDRWADLSPRMASGIAWAGLFVLTMLAASLLARLGRKMLEAMQLGLLDRIGGAILGGLTGTALHVALLVILCQLGTETFVTRTLTGSVSEQVVDVVAARWPVLLGAEAGEELDEFLDRVRLRAAAEETPPGVVR